MNHLFLKISIWNKYLIIIIFSDRLAVERFVLRRCALSPASKRASKRESGKRRDGTSCGGGRQTGSEEGVEQRRSVRVTARRRAVRSNGSPLPRRCGLDAWLQYSVLVQMQHTSAVATRRKVLAAERDKVETFAAERET